MGMLGSVVLLLLSALACEEQLAKKRARLRFWLQALAPLSGLLGLGAAINGLFCIVTMLAYLGFIRYAPVVYLGSLGAGVASLLLGVRFGHGTAMLWLGDRLKKSQRAAADRLHQTLCSHESTLGYAGLALGLFCLLINVVK
jgi:hypothetical protein